MAKVVASNATNSWRGENDALLVEQIAAMLHKEVSRYRCIDYLQCPSGGEGVVTSDPIDERWRQKSAEWMFKVVDFYDLERDIVNVGMTYLDRVFTETTLHHRWNKRQCRLIVTSSLKLAIKLNEPRTLNMEDMMKLDMGADLTFSAGARVEMEYEILRKLRWDIFPPTTFCFAHYMICTMPLEITRSTRYTLQELAKYITELAICVYSFVKYKASSKAFACILVAVESSRDECDISREAEDKFLERISTIFSLSDEDNHIKILRKAFRDLLHHNTNLPEFIALIRASNHEAESDSPKSSATKLGFNDALSSAK